VSDAIAQSPAQAIGIAYGYNGNSGFIFSFKNGGYIP
jgi:hypothetical protein